MGNLKCDQSTSHGSEWPVNSHWDRYWVFFSCLTEVKKSRSVKNWHPSYYLLMLNTCYGPDNVQTSLLCPCNTELPRARLVCMVWTNDLFIIVMEADRVLTMSVHSVKHVTFSHSFSPRKNLLWHVLSLSHFINEEIKDQANCPWSHSDKWPNQGWILGFGARRPLMQEPLMQCPDGDADTISLVVHYNEKTKPHTWSTFVLLPK